MTHPLVAEATKKAAVAWIAVGARPPRALWCLGLEGSLWLVTGPGEQAAPELTEPELTEPEPAAAGTALVTLRGDHGGQIVTWRAVVERVDPASPEWAETVPLLAGKRLNAPVPATALVQRWAAECTVLKLTPVEGPVVAGADLPEASGAAPPRESPARRRVSAPFRLHRVRRR